jgi:hypothetical protein
MQNQTPPKSRWAGIGWIVAGIIAIVWGFWPPGYFGLQYIIEGDTWDAWFGFILTFVFMVGLGILFIWIGINERRQREQQS